VKKWIAIFYLLLVAAGSFYPCCLDDDCASESAQLQSSTQDNGDDDNDPGFCSPFSACASCAVSVKMELLHIAVKPPASTSPSYNAYCVTDREGVYPVMFQPPRC
jgi:hypothetical protein